MYYWPLVYLAIEEYFCSCPFFAILLFQHLTSPCSSLLSCEVAPDWSSPFRGTAPAGMSVTKGSCWSQHAFSDELRSAVRCKGSAVCESPLWCMMCQKNNKLNSAGMADGAAEQDRDRASSFIFASFWVWLLIAVSVDDASLNRKSKRGLRSCWGFNSHYNSQ